MRRQEAEGMEAGSLLVWDPKVLNQYEGKYDRPMSAKSALSEICHAPPPGQIFMMLILNQSIVEDYLKEARNHVPEAMKVMEDALLIWLAYSEYDTDKAIRSLID